MMWSNMLLDCAVLLVVGSSLDGKAKNGAFAFAPTTAPTITFSRNAGGFSPQFGTTVKTEVVVSQASDQLLSPAFVEHPTTTSSSREFQRKEWARQALEYYSGVMRGSAYQRTVLNTEELTKDGVSPKEHYDEDYLHYALRHYFALHKIRKGAPQHAERIYRKIISEIMADESEHADEPGGCKQASLAVSTLLLALLLQREGQIEDARSVFDQFLQSICPSSSVAPPKCACCARVIQAYALFEMKHGDSVKSLELIWRAIRMDKSLRPILQWKHFRRAMERKRDEMSNRNNRRKSALQP